MNIIKIKLTIHENCIRDITVKIKYFSVWMLYVEK